MAFDESCEGALNVMKSSASLSLTYSNRCLNHMSDAWVHWYSNQDHNAIEDVLSGLSDANAAAGYAGWGYDPFAYVGPWWWYLTNCIEGGTLTMADIITAMHTASNEELKTFIGLVDAYRISLWNKPFESDFYAAIARGFE